VGHESGQEAELAGAAHYGHELFSLAEGGISARDLHGGGSPELERDLVQAAKDLGKGDVLDPLGALGEVAESAIQVAPLRDLQGHAPDRVPPAEDLVLPEELAHPPAGAFERQGAVLADGDGSALH